MIGCLKILVLVKKRQAVIQSYAHQERLWLCFCAPADCFTTRNSVNLYIWLLTFFLVRIQNSYQVPEFQNSKIQSNENLSLAILKVK